MPADIFSLICICRYGAEERTWLEDDDAPRAEPVSDGRKTLERADSSGAVRL